jgi:hypothetical protein
MMIRRHRRHGAIAVEHRFPAKGPPFIKSLSDPTDTLSPANYTSRMAAIPDIDRYA